MNNRVEPNGDFSGVSFSKRSFFDKAKFKKLVLKNTEFSDVASFNQLKCNELEISRTVFSKGADFLHASIKIANRESFRIIKNEFLKLNNVVEALHFRSKEMKAYEKEVRSRKTGAEFGLLVLNKISNNHGLSWFRGVKFTVCIAVFFYALYLWSLERLPFHWGWVNFESFWSATGENIKYFIRFFIPTHDLDFMSGFGTSALSFVIDVLSKIFIGYAIYQTIQAFRKFGKI